MHFFILIFLFYFLLICILIFFRNIKYLNDSEMQSLLSLKHDVSAELNFSNDIATARPDHDFLEMKNDNVFLKACSKKGEESVAHIRGAKVHFQAQQSETAENSRVSRVYN